MSSAHRTTIALEPEIHRALKLKSLATQKSMSRLINEAVRMSLAEDLEDARDLDVRADEPSRPFEEFLEDLSDAGKI